MTDILSRPEWHTTAGGPDAELAELRRRVAAAELRVAHADERALRSAQREDFAQFTLDTTKTRADRLEPALQKALIDLITPRLPKKLRDSAEAIADTMVDDIAAGTTYDELDIDGHVQAYLEER